MNPSQQAWHAWRERRIERLKAPDGWLTLTGLYWLEPGTYIIGNVPHADIELPPEAGSDVALHVTVDLQQGVHATPVAPHFPTNQNQSIRELFTWRDDTRSDAQVLHYGPVALMLIQRSGHLGVRVRFENHPNRTAFKGVPTFEFNHAWQVTGRYHAYNPPHVIDIVNVVGLHESKRVPGYVEFEKEGQMHRLDVFHDEGDTSLFIVFADATSGKSTYGPGRFLSVDLPNEHNEVLIDFNRAYNPPCYFTHFATCPLPPKQNKLTLLIDAGEKKE